MAKIVFIGAGSAIFLKNLVGDCLVTEALGESEIALVDIDPRKLELSARLIERLNQRLNGGRAKVTAHLDRRQALPGADFVVNAIQVGGYGAVLNDFEIPLRYGLRQTYADTLGVGGIFRGLRTAPVVLEIASDMAELCPQAWLLNYANPMAIVTGAVLKASPIRAVGLCHSVQVCARELLEELGLDYPEVEYTIAGVNHQAWLLEITSRGKDLYPEIKAAAARLGPHADRARLEIMEKFGYYVTESSLHTAEYTPYFIKKAYPGLAEQYGIRTEMFREWSQEQDKFLRETAPSLLREENLVHARSHEYASRIVEAVLTGLPFRFNGNVLNAGYIENLPQGSCVEVPCVAGAEGIAPQRVGALPPQCAALNRTYLNVVELAIEAALTRRKEHLYHAALLDPHTAAELTAGEILRLCDEMLEANRAWLSGYD